MKKQIRKQFTLWKLGLRQPSDPPLRLIVSLLAFLLLLATGAQAALLEVDRTDGDASATACTGAPLDCSLQGEEGRPAMIPEWAEEVEPDVWYLGQELDPQSGEMVDGWIFVHRVDDHRIGPQPPGQNAKPGSCSATQDFGPWRTTETWSGNFTNHSGISEADVLTALTAAQTTYETQTGMDIFGALVEAPPGYIPADPPGLDGQNYVWFGDTGAGNIVAIAGVWGIQTGPPSNRQILEFKILFQNRFFQGQPVKTFTVIPEVETGWFDLENTAAHEFGHAVGLAHPDNSCTEETMFGGLAVAETKKRTLNAGDIAGLDKLY